jgi:hypothetical protein
MSFVLFQRQAVPAIRVLPSWISGFTFSEVVSRDPLTRSAVAALPVDQRELVVRIDPADAVAQAVAERVAVDARDAGFSIKVQAPAGLAPRPDARLVRVRVVATTPERAFSDAMAKLRGRGVEGSSTDPAINSPDDVYRAELALLDRSVVIPIVHLPDLYAATDRVLSWQSKPVLGTGVWNLADVWIRGQR